jgi:hypothetical protein
MLKVKKVFQIAASTVLFASAFAAPNANAAQSQTFTASLSTTEFLMPSADCVYGFAGVGAGVGSSNLFAKKPSTTPVPAGMTSTDCVSQNAPTLPPPSLSFTNGKLFLVGPAGDSITATYQGDLMLVPTATTTTAGQTYYTYSFNTPANFIITGGTGRFAKATGTGTISGVEVVNFVTGSSQGKLTAQGTVNY